MYADVQLPKLPGLLRCRLEAALTQRELAALAHVARPRISKLERGEAAARISTMRRLAEALKRDPRELMTPD